MLRYADTLTTGAATITPHLVADWGSTYLEAYGTYSQFTSGGWSTQGSLAASRFIPTSRGLLGEVGGFAGGSTHNDGTRTGEILANGVSMTRGEVARCSRALAAVGPGMVCRVEKRTAGEAGASVGLDQRARRLR